MATLYVFAEVRAEQTSGSTMSFTEWRPASENPPRA